MKGFILERCMKFSDLGIVVDNTLSFANHIEYICNNAMKVLGFVIRNTVEGHLQCSLTVLQFSTVKVRVLQYRLVPVPANLYVTT